MIVDAELKTPTDPTGSPYFEDQQRDRLSSVKTFADDMGRVEMVTRLTPQWKHHLLPQGELIFEELPDFLHVDHDIIL